MIMTTKYENDVVNLFYNFKEQNVVAKYSEIASLKAILGTNLKNQSILDVGCGFGYHARWLAAEGANVIGIDCSEEQIMRALELEQKDPKGVNFLIADAAHLPKTNQYDICILAYMLQCANSEVELTQYFFSASNNLKQSGKVVGVFNNCYEASIVSKYGYHFHDSALRAKPGDLFTGEPKVDDGQEIYSCQQLKIDKDLIQRVSKLTGFKEVVWHKPTVSEDGLKALGEEFWADYLNVPVDQYFVIYK